MNGLILGFGRMGLTHMALANGLSKEVIKWYVYEPSRINRLLMKNLNQYIHLEWVDDKWLEAFYGKIDIGFVCSPPSAHKKNVENLTGKIRRIFVEKPVGVEDLSLFEGYECAMVGYVLRHNKMVQLAKQFTTVNKVKEITFSLNANTILSATDGWRGDSSRGGGVINEFGSHLINLMLYLVDAEVQLTSVELAGVFSPGAEDKALLQFSGQELNVKMELNWSDSGVRKPIYRIQGVAATGEEFFTDLYEFSVDKDGETAVHENIASVGEHVDFYLRGFEFSRQMTEFLHGEFDSKALADAVRTDEFIKEVKSWK